MKGILKHFVPAFAVIYMLAWTVAPQPGSIAPASRDKAAASSAVMKLDYPAAAGDPEKFSVDSLPTLAIPQMLAGFYNATSEVQPIFLVETSGLELSTDLFHVIYPLGASTATSIAIRVLLQTGNTIVPTGDAHGVAFMGQFKHTQPSEYPLGIALEGKCGNEGGGLIPFCIGVESQLSENNGSMNFVGFNAQVTSNTGTLFGFFGMKLGVMGNTQPIPLVEGIQVQDIDEGSGQVEEINGLHFKNQTQNSATTKRAVWVEDPEAVIETVGPIIAPGITVQTVNAPVSVGRSGTGMIPPDGTKPQNHQGTEFMTVSITPKDPDNILRIEYEAALSSGQSAQVVTALFRDSQAITLDAKADFIIGNTMNTVHGSYEMEAGTTSPITFRLRAGRTSAGLLYMNTINGQAFLGDSIHSYLRVTERRPNASTPPPPGGNDGPQDG